MKQNVVAYSRCLFRSGAAQGNWRVVLAKWLVSECLYVDVYKCGVCQCVCIDWAKCMYMSRAYLYQVPLYVYDVVLACAWFNVFATQRHRRRHCFLSVRSFVCPDRSCYCNISRTAWAVSMKLTGNIHEPLLITWLDSGGQGHSRRSTWRWHHVDTAGSKSIFWLGCIF